MTKGVFVKILIGFLAFYLWCFAAAAQQPSTIQAPDFTLKSLSGKNIRLSDLKGQVILINMWASWCGPCRQEMPFLEKIYQQFKDDDFLILGINLDEVADKRDSFLDSVTISFPVLNDSRNQVAKLYDNSEMPSSYFIDRDGALRYVHQGYKKGKRSVYQYYIERLLEE